MSIEQQVRDAFQVEHREQLQRIRSLLSDAEGHGSTVREQCLDEAFRMAHSLKGGARVCDLRPAETLGHGLETIFSKVREGMLEMDDRVAKTVSCVLDGIEDWMANLQQTDVPPDPVEALQAIEDLLQEASPTAALPQVDILSEFECQLKLAFLEEAPRYVDGLQTFLDDCDPDVPPGPPRTNEAFCLAHDLRASARAAQLGGVESLAAPLEELFRQLRDGTSKFDIDARAAARASLDAVSRQMMEVRHGSDVSTRPLPPDGNGGGPASAKRLGHDSEEPPTFAAAVDAQYETVRVRGDHLDRLMQSSSQLVAESIRQDQVTRELDELKATVETMQRERDALRRIAGASLHVLNDSPEMRRLGRYIESTDRNLNLLGQNTRKLYLKHQRSCWLLRSHAKRIQDELREARMITVQSIFQGFPKMVRDLARDENKQVEFKMTGVDVRADRMVLQALKDPVMHMLRNAITHGVESADVRIAQDKPGCGQVSLSVHATGNHLQVAIRDDGHGIDFGRIAEVAVARRHDEDSPPEFSDEELTRLIFTPGFSTSASVTELSGRGMGLSVVQETVHRLQGSVQLLDEGAGTTILLSVPLSAYTHRLLLVTACEQTFAVPLHAIERLVQIRVEDIETLEGTPVVMHQEQLIPITSMAALVGVGERPVASADQRVSVLIMKSGPRRLAVIVEAFVGEREAFIQALDVPSASSEYAGAIFSEDGYPVLVLNPSQLIERDQFPSETFDQAAPAERAEARVLQVLVVDDSFTTRTLEKSILETHGYQVHVAMDGVEALQKLQTHEFDAVISDLEMPRLDGFGLLEEMKRQDRFSSIPVILVTSRDCAEDQQRGLELGAEAYIIKRKFDHQDLLNTIEQVIAC